MFNHTGIEYKSTLLTTATKGLEYAVYLSQYNILYTSMRCTLVYIFHKYLATYPFLLIIVFYNTPRYVGVLSLYYVRLHCTSLP